MDLIGEIDAGLTHITYIENDSKNHDKVQRTYPQTYV